MSTPRKSTSHMATPLTPRRPCTPESIHGRSPRAPGPPSSPDRRSTSGDKPTKSYLRPTVSSILHHGNTNTHKPRRSIDKPPFLPPSSVGVNTQHHKNPSSSSKGSLSLKGILTRATNAMKAGTGQRKTTTSAGINIGKGSGSSTPVRPRSPASMPKKKDGSRNFARSNSVPKKMGVINKEEHDKMSICSIEDNFTEHLPDLVEITPDAPQNVVQLRTPDVMPQEPCYTEKTEDKMHEEIIAASDISLIEENHKESKLEEVNESPKGVISIKFVEEYREEQPVMEEEVKETPKDTESEVIVEKQEDVPEVESVNAVEELPQDSEKVSIVEEQENVKPEETGTELPKKPDEVIFISTEEETKEEPKELEEKEITTAENIEGPKEEVETYDTVEHETKEENVSFEEKPKEEENGGLVEEVPKVEVKPIVIETEKKEELVVTPEVEEKPISTVVLVSDPTKEKTAIRKPDAVATRREGAVSNDVIEETKIKLMEKKKNKVLALAGAFETIMQKPEGSTRR